MTDAPPTAELTATLVIGRSYSRCDNCGEDTLPQDTHHVDISGWTPQPGAGCGARYVAMRSDYGGTGDELKAMRPDLPIEDAQADQLAPDPSDAELIEHAREVGMVEPEKAPAFVAAYRARIAELDTAVSPPTVPQLADVEEQQGQAAAEPVARPAGLDALLGYVAANLPAEDDTPTGEKYPSRLGIYCDTCRITIEGDFTVTDTMSKAQRLDAVRQHVSEMGWQCDAAGDYCPKCLPCAHESWDVTGEHKTDAGWVKTRQCNDCTTSLAAIIEPEPHWDIQPGAPLTAAEVEEQRAPLTLGDRADHAISLYATTAVELEDARRDVATLRARVAELESAAQPLTAAERQFLTFALDEAADEMANRDGFTDEDTAALDTFRRMASTAPEADDQAEEQPAVPTIGSRYVKRTEPDAGRIVTVNRVWNPPADDQPAVAYEWHDPRASYAGSACRLDVFHRTYRAKTSR